MTDDRIIASPMLDRERVANAIQRGVRLQLDPARAKAALRGQPVELEVRQAHDIADVALEALAKTHPDGKAWLVKANEDYRKLAETDDLSWRTLLAIQRRKTDTWRASALNSYLLFAGTVIAWELHCPRWAYALIYAAALGASAALRVWLMRCEQRRAASR